jgi:hypothetical protein
MAANIATTAVLLAYFICMSYPLDCNYQLPDSQLNSMVRVVPAPVKLTAGPKKDKKSLQNLRHPSNNFVTII